MILLDRWALFVNNFHFSINNLIVIINFQALKRLETSTFILRVIQGSKYREKERFSAPTVSVIFSGLQALIVYRVIVEHESFGWHVQPYTVSPSNFLAEKRWGTFGLPFLLGHGSRQGCTTLTMRGRTGVVPSGGLTVPPCSWWWWVRTAVLPVVAP